jgi:hypothetical protein
VAGALTPAALSVALLQLTRGATAVVTAESSAGKGRPHVSTAPGDAKAPPAAAQPSPSMPAFRNLFQGSAEHKEVLDSMPQIASVVAERARRSADSAKKPAATAAAAAAAAAGSRVRSSQSSSATGAAAPAARTSNTRLSLGAGSGVAVKRLRADSLDLTFEAPDSDSDGDGGVETLTAQDHP